MIGTTIIVHTVYKREKCVACSTKCVALLETIIAPLHSSGLFVCLFGFLTSSSATKLYRGRVAKQTFSRAATQRKNGETMTSVSAGHIILIPTHPAGSGRPEPGSKLPPPDQKSRALPTKLTPTSP